ncbi:MAG: OmpH family outer membrane protein [Thermoflavifilum sp.]|uniref:OmpH family outer membrane protein n=1 Tax=Thermoflavifilum sp. TaxID=1968839 RepID=UPI0018A38450|nr:OmpH family outer membrane protein [Thermoflavifilum sp.]QOR74963.1 MAG: OmpH family outer membrane protein [Thermoflavifilum sp.]
MYKKTIIILVGFVLAGVNAFAQRYCVIDSKYILEHIPAYQQAQQQLDSVSKAWQQEIDAQYQQLDEMYRSYQAEKVILNEDLRKKREDEIVAKEKAVRDLQNQRFGYQGDLFKLRQKLVQPIQDEVYQAVQKLAAQRSYDFVLDKAGGITVFYADPRLDKSDDVLNLLGIQK